MKAMENKLLHGEKDAGVWAWVAGDKGSRDWQVEIEEVTGIETKVTS